MVVNNSEVVEKFREIANLLAIKGANEFRVRAYRNAAQTLSGMSKRVEDLVEEDADLRELEEIGQDLADKIRELVQTGSIKMLEDLHEEMPAQLSKMLELPGLGPKRVQAIYDELGIGGLEELKEAAENEELQDISGLGAKTEEKILEGIKTREEDGYANRHLLSRGEEVAKNMQDYLQQVSAIDEFMVAGSYRRRQETVGDLDIVVCGENHQRIISEFVNYPDVIEIISQGDTKASIKLRSHRFQVDLRVVDAKSYGAAVHYFTGSKEHSVALRELAQDRGLKINEYGVFKGNERIGGETEEDIYQALDLSYIPPELREKRGEIEAARDNKLPELLELEDIKGDLQMHTDATDGSNSIEEMIQGAIERGYEYIAITDHSQKVKMAHGLGKERLQEQIERIQELNEKYSEIEILAGVEVDILKDGSLDLSNEILKELDIRVCSIHYHMNLSKEKQTQRLMKAMEHPYCQIIAHPTGRKLQEREPYPLDMNRVMKKAKETGCYLEINAQPRRLDLADFYIKKAREMGLKLAISTDAHRRQELDYMKYGVAQARRGWLEKDDLLNTRRIDELKELLRR